MNNSQTSDHHYINTAEALNSFYQANHSVEWMGFDTEFVGEKTFVPLLCLIQVTTPNGTYLIDTIRLQNIEPFLKLIKDPKILKITHAGENDYRLIYQKYHVLPQNIFDTQIAGGFIGYNYPVSFANLLAGELKIRLDKGSAVSDWESRPISKKQLQYALNDVIYLERLWKKISKKLHDKNRETWVNEEFEKMQQAKSYANDGNKEFLSNSMIPKLKDPEKLFLLRLYRWRISMAEQKNYPKERILQKKLIAHIVKGVKGGKEALLHNRLIPEHVVQKNAKTFEQLYQAPITKEEQGVLNSVMNNKPINPKIDAVMDILYLGMKIICAEQKVAPELVVNRSNFKKMKWDLDYFDNSLTDTWRYKLLGENVINSIKKRSELQVNTKGEYFGLEQRNKDN